MLIYRRKYFLTFLGNFLDAFGPIAVLVVGGYMVIRNQTDVSTLVVFISGFQKLADPWDQLVNFYRTVSNARVTYGLIADVLGGTGHGAVGRLDLRLTATGVGGVKKRSSPIGAPGRS